MKKQRDYTNRTLVQADEVLRVVAESREPLGLTEIIKAADLPKDAVFRILWNLERLNWIKEVGGKYQLDLKLALLWARYKTRREAERDAIEKELKELEVEDGT